MKELTNLGMDVSSGNKDIKYDKIIKNILAYKPILSRIFKETVVECKDMSYEEIEKCIEGEIEIDVVGLNPGTTNAVKIEGRTQEDAVYGEGKVTFDIRTVIRIPGTDNTIGVKLLVDVEAQKDDTPGYDISERAIYYCARMLSSQLGPEFTNTSADKVKYGNLKKAYSIWICMEASQKRANTIERYSIQRQVYPKEKEGMSSRYDLMEAVIVNISAKHDDEDSESELIQMLTDLFNENLSAQEKVDTLKSKYGVPTTYELEEEVAGMTVFAANLIKKGLEEGLEKGRAEARAEARAEVIERMILKKYPKEAILDLGYTEAEYQEVEQKLLATV